MTRTHTVEPTAEELDSTDTVECSGYCGEKVLESETVDVIAGQEVGEWDEQDGVPAHTGVTGVEGKYPSVQKWCATCAENEFEIKKTSSEKVQEVARSRFTRSNIKSAVVGGLTVLMVVMFVLMFVP